MECLETRLNIFFGKNTKPVNMKIITIVYFYHMSCIKRRFTITMVTLNEEGSLRNTCTTKQMLKQITFTNNTAKQNL